MRRGLTVYLLMARPQRPAASTPRPSGSFSVPRRSPSCSPARRRGPRLARRPACPAESASSTSTRQGRRPPRDRRDRAAAFAVRQHGRCDRASPGYADRRRAAGLSRAVLARTGRWRQRSRELPAALIRRLADAAAGWRAPARRSAGRKHRRSAESEGACAGARGQRALRSRGSSLASLVRRDHLVFSTARSQPPDPVGRSSFITSRVLLWGQLPSSASQRR